jgi:hypothetical protein
MRRGPFGIDYLTGACVVSVIGIAPTVFMRQQDNGNPEGLR